MHSRRGRGGGGVGEAQGKFIFYSFGQFHFCPSTKILPPRARGRRVCVCVCACNSLNRVPKCYYFIKINGSCPLILFFFRFSIKVTCAFYTVNNKHEWNKIIFWRGAASWWKILSLVLTFVMTCHLLLLSPKVQFTRYTVEYIPYRIDFAAQ